MHWEALVFTERTTIGLDVHARSVRAAALDTVTGELREAKLAGSNAEVVDWVLRCQHDFGQAAVTYEAGPTGFGLARALEAVGMRCVVAAPSKIRRAAGDRVKTDAKDALLLARMLRMVGRFRDSGANPATQPDPRQLVGTHHPGDALVVHPPLWLDAVVEFDGHPGHPIGRITPSLRVLHGADPYSQDSVVLSALLTGREGFLPGVERGAGNSITWHNRFTG